MNAPVPQIGLHKADIDTPALLLEVDVMDGNLMRMAEFFADKQIKLRPHVKIYRGTPELARRQLAVGAIGVTCAKLSEAEVLNKSGIKDILIANQIAGSKKIDRLIKLAAQSELLVAVDNKDNALAISKAAKASGVSIGILVEVNIGHNRCGVSPFEETLKVANHVQDLPCVEFQGLMGYDGHCTIKVEESDREELSRRANMLLADTRKYLEDAGLEVKIVSGSGTFTYRFASQVEGISEIQAGTYLLMDTAFQEHGVREFDCTLSVLTTIISMPTYPDADGMVIVDAGRKSLSVDLGVPEVKYPDGAQVRSLSDEHGRVILGAEKACFQVGDKIELWVRDANGTIPLFDRFYCIRDDHVVDVWNIPLCGINT
jgi:D-serine deaminase-like pyridoxal phosphate-dependent protein